MITIDGVTYRNLEEQVRFNQQNISTSATAIAAETERAKVAEAANATAISNETTARANADTALGERIDTERKTANDEYVRNMLHLGYYDTYTIDTNGNYVVTRQTGYKKLSNNSSKYNFQVTSSDGANVFYNTEITDFDANFTENLIANVETGTLS